MHGTCRWQKLNYCERKANSSSNVMDVAHRGARGLAEELRAAGAGRDGMGAGGNNRPTAHAL